ncbi:MAG: hypothetical protein HYZ27_11265 [Deltaproteobacteria bacterium]|nr:hypothetical protein [Deltaproteobacteria bacterium]
MIGGGGSIGNKPPGAPPPKIADAPAAAPTAKPGDAARPAPSDQFEKTARPRLDGGIGAANRLAREASGPTDLLMLARDNPAAARQLVATLAGQSAAALSEIERELVGARALLEKLAAERFAKGARDKVGEELNKHRARIAALKLHYAMASRKTALLQQLAGRLGDPRLSDEIDRILSQHNKLKSRWGKRHHLLASSEAIFGDEADTPAHLKEVVSTDMRGSGSAPAVGDALHEISPRRIISEVIARTLDGSERAKGDAHVEALRGEHGKALQHYALLADLLESALERDPFGGGHGPSQR